MKKLLTILSLVHLISCSSSKTFNCEGYELKIMPKNDFEGTIILDNRTYSSAFTRTDEYFIGFADDDLGAYVQFYREDKELEAKDAFGSFNGYFECK